MVNSQFSQPPLAPGPCARPPRRRPPIMFNPGRETRQSCKKYSHKYTHPCLNTRSIDDCGAMLEGPPCCINHTTEGHGARIHEEEHGRLSEREHLRHVTRLRGREASPTRTKHACCPAGRCTVQTGEGGGGRGSTALANSCWMSGRSMVVRSCACAGAAAQVSKRE